MFLRAVLGSFVCLTTIIHASPIGGVIGDAGPHNALQQRNILVPGYLIPVTTVDADVVAGTPATASRERVPTGTIAVVKRAVTSMPNLVPTSQVDLATDTVGTQIISPLFVPTVVADIGVATPGCAVYISDYSYITQCAYTTTPQPTSTGLANCCGGQGSLHPCNDAGTVPAGPGAWTCTFGSTTCAGVSTATTMWT
ncbi:hypothetical protein LTR53_012413 [Teratosphaeriaceae sp. CCFEE 6253]|nr:hypothetical protein LTR53_012413 [Teratosphaeriaceae sp. CCFEE 6253]